MRRPIGKAKGCKDLKKALRQRRLQRLVEVRAEPLELKVSLSELIIRGLNAICYEFDRRSSPLYPTVECQGSLNLDIYKFSTV